MLLLLLFLSTEITFTYISFNDNYDDADDDDVEHSSKRFLMSLSFDNLTFDSHTCLDEQLVKLALPSIGIETGIGIDTGIDIETGMNLAARSMDQPENANLRGSITVRLISCFLF